MDSEISSTYVDEKELHFGTGSSTENVMDELEKQPVAPPAPQLDSFTPAACFTIAGAWMVQFCTFGYVNAYGVYQDYYTREFLSNHSASDISWIGSFQLFLMYAPGIIVGRAFDRGYFHHLQIGGALLYVFSLFMLSLTKPNHFYQVFLSQGVGMGLGLGATFLPSISIVSHHFKARRSLATGIVVTGASTGGIVFPILLNNLFSNPSLGFRGGVWVSGGIVGGMLLLANLMMRTNQPPSTRKPSLNAQDRRRILLDGAYLFSIAGAFFTVLGIFMPFFYLQLFAVDRGIHPTVARYVLTILNAGSIAGRLLPPFLADKFGVYNVLLPSMGACAVMLFSIFGINTSAEIIVFALFFGFFSGAYVSLIPPLLATMCKDMSELGVRIGFAFSVVALSMLAGNPIAGAVLGVGDGAHSLKWWAAIVFAGLCAATGLVFMTLSRIAFGMQKTQRQS